MNNEDYVIFGCKVAELEKTGDITFTADMDYADLVQLAEKIYDEFTKDNSCNYFSEFVPFALRERQKAQYKYYVEVWFNTREDGDYPYLLQSQWYDTKDECYDFVESFDYVDKDLRFSLMTAKFDKDGNYGDIEMLEEDVIREKNNYGHN